jgi:hypothetical protein
MAAIVTVEANNLLTGSLGIGAFSAPTTPMKLALESVAGSASAAGTEVTGGSYARQTWAGSAASAGATSNNALITYTNMPAITSVAVAIYDSAGTPIRKWFGPLGSNKTTGAGDTLSFASTTVAATLT